MLLSCWFALAVVLEDENPVVDLWRPFAGGKQLVGISSEGCEQICHLIVTPTDEDGSAAVGFVKVLSEGSGVVGAKAGIDRQGGGLAERDQGLAWTDASFGVCAGDQSVNCERLAGELERCEVICVGVGACLAFFVQRAAGGGLF